MSKITQIIVINVVFLISLIELAGSNAAGIDTVSGKLREAVDRREANNTIVEEAVNGGDREALRLWGLIGEQACPVIRPHIRSTADWIKIAALKGLANCRAVDAFSDVLQLANKSPNGDIRQAALEALAFVTLEESRQQHMGLVAELLGRDAADEEKAAAVYGLMQSNTYSGLTPADLPLLNFDLLLHMASMPGASGFEAAYLLSRLRGLDAVYSSAAIMNATSGNVPVSQRYALAKTLAQFEDASAGLLALAAGHNSADPAERRVAVAAVRSMGAQSDATTRTYLMTLLINAMPEFQHLALAALASRPDADLIVQERIWDFVEDENPWLAVTALEGLVALEDGKAIEAAGQWLETGSFYKAFRSIAMLSTSDAGREKLRVYAAANTGTVRARQASGALDPTANPAAPGRLTVPYEEAVASTGYRLQLVTSRGDITIEMIDGAPYAVHNFIDLARTGELDGMLWHRVIPGFVAQAGQRDTMDQYTTGTIREEWGAALHEPGTVGVATAGPDTGSSQFFINLERNRHLDGRYTVFGKVTNGLDVAYALQEGDMIVKAMVIAN